jgi:hypothetical protein
MKLLTLITAVTCLLPSALTNPIQDKEAAALINGDSQNINFTVLPRSQATSPKQKLDMAMRPKNPITVDTCIKWADDAPWHIRCCNHMRNIVTSNNGDCVHCKSFILLLSYISLS